jgi:hypothetical protein
MIVCLHEEMAVFMAIGDSKVTGTLLVTILHDTVGLLHGTMDVYDAYDGAAYGDLLSMAFRGRRRVSHGIAGRRDADLSRLSRRRRSSLLGEPASRIL